MSVRSGPALLPGAAIWACLFVSQLSGTGRCSVRDGAPSLTEKAVCSPFLLWAQAPSFLWSKDPVTGTITTCNSSTGDLRAGWAKLPHKMPGAFPAATLLRLSDLFQNSLSCRP